MEETKKIEIGSKFMPKKYRGYKTHVNWSLKWFVANHKARRIEYNLNFINSCTKGQITYILEWCIVSRRIKNKTLCDEKAIERCVKMGIDKNEIIDLIKNSQIANKKIRLFNAMTESIEKFEQKKPLLYLWKKIKELWKNPLG